MDKRVLQRSLKALQVLGDAGFIMAALVLAYYARFFLQVIPVKYGIPDIKYYLFAAPAVLLILMLAMNYAGLYRETRKPAGLDGILNIFISITAGTVMILAATFFVRGFTYSRAVILFMWILSAVFVTAWRMIYSAFFSLLSKKGFITRRIAVLGATKISAMLIERLKREPGTGYRITGCVDNKLKKGGKFAGVPVLGKTKDLKKIVEKYRLDEVFIGLADYNRKETADMIMENEKIKFMIASDVLGIITKSIDYDEIFGIPVFSVRELPLKYARNRFIKRAFDIAGSFFGLLILSPLFAVVAVLIKLDSGGPVFYRQERVGRDGKIFRVFKFRTMRNDAERRTGPVWAKEDDPRRTRIGAFLRKTSIDELPQLINILTGEMSIVGPRPERPFFVEKFKKDVPRYIERHKVKSGLTGWAQVNGLRGNTSLEERVKYDLYYIENWSLSFELKIIVRTVLEVFHHEDAY
jgi:exopolysaccharide biosynthesis polyprenyl glycosylphosphotransferase